MTGRIERMEKTRAAMEVIQGETPAKSPHGSIQQGGDKG